LATFEQAITKIRADAPSNSSNTVRAGAAISSRNGLASILNPASAG
jgi:hypothetical protein